MPRQTWSPNRERQYVHIKDNLENQGKSASLAEEIAVRTVKEERAARRVEGGQPVVARGHIVPAPRWHELPLRSRWPHSGPTAQ